MLTPARLRRLAILALAVSFATACSPGSLSLLGLQSSQTGQQTDSSSVSSVHSGRVLGLDGKPAANVTVRAFLVSNNAGSLISNNSGNLISHNGSKYRVAAADLETRTDANGDFSLRFDAGTAANVEAVLSDDVKAILQNVTGDALTLQLAYTGGISGRVKAPDAPTVTDFEGVDVFIPGTSYVAKADATGHFTLDHVAPGTFTVVASKQGLGRAQVDGVAVASRATAQTPDLALSVHAPDIATMSSAVAAPGSVVTLSGDGFGASAGLPFDVHVGGVAVTLPVRVDDHTIRVTIPVGAQSGEVVVTVDGIPSLPQSLRLLSRLSIVPSATFMRLGRSLDLALVGVDLDGQAAASPSAEIRVEGPGIRRTATGVEAIAVGTGSITARAGTLTSRVDVQVVNDSVVTTLSGTGETTSTNGPAPLATFHTPDGVAVGPDGSVYVAEWDGNRVRRIAPDGTVTTLAGNGQGVDLDGHGTAARLDHPRGVCVDPVGNVYVTEWETAKIRKITPSGDVTTLAPSYTFYTPYGIAADGHGNVYVTEVGRHRLLKIASNGTVDWIAGSQIAQTVDGAGLDASFNQPHGLAFDRDGYLLVADYADDVVRKVDLSQTYPTVSTIMGPTWTDSIQQIWPFHGPHDLGVAPDGTVYVSDSGNNFILAWKNGAVHHVAGRGIAGFADGDRVTSAFRTPRGLAVLPDGSLVVSDSGNHRIRLVQP